MQHNLYIAAIAQMQLCEARQVARRGYPILSRIVQMHIEGHVDLALGSEDWATLIEGEAATIGVGILQRAPILSHRCGIYRIDQSTDVR